MDQWAHVESAMDLDGVLLQALVALAIVGALLVATLYANERDEETGSRSLTVADLKRFRSLSAVEKVFAALVVTLVAGITVSIALTIGIALR